MTLQGCLADLCHLFLAEAELLLFSDPTDMFVQ